jgi:hypothetical protein
MQPKSSSINDDRETIKQVYSFPIVPQQPNIPSGTAGD